MTVIKIEVTEAGKATDKNDKPIWKMKAMLAGVSRDYPEPFQMNRDVPAQDPEIGDVLNCEFERGNLKRDKTGEYQNQYFWNLAKWGVGGETTPMSNFPSLAGGGQQSQSSQAPQNKREAGEQMSEASSYPPQQIGQSWNVASHHVDSEATIYDTLDDWWNAVEYTAAFVLPRLGKEPQYPAPDVPQGDSGPVAEQMGTIPPDRQTSPKFNADGTEIKAEFSAESQTFIAFCKAKEFTTKQVTGWLGISAADWKASRIDKWLALHEGATAQDAIDRVQDRAHPEADDELVI